MRLGFALLVAAAIGFAGDPCVLGPYTAAGNFAADLDGKVEPGDHDMGIWGTREAYGFPLTLRPPEGYRVRILRVSADLTARLTTKGHTPAAPLSGQYVGVLLAVATKHPSQGSARADWAADDTLAYGQADIGTNGVARIVLREDHEGVENTLLGADNKLWFVVAKYLDETGYATHLEATFSSVRYQFEREGCRCRSRGE